MTWGAPQAHDFRQKMKDAMPPAPGLFISPSRAMHFDFDGRRIAAMEGDTVAVALWRAGVKTISRSFKYHRRRGILSLSGADGNTLADIDGEPDVRLDRVRAKPGMVVRSRHADGNAEQDRLSAMGMLSPLLPPGFYYRAFYKPHGAWPRWEPLIRRLAGRGHVNPAARPPAADIRRDFCDVAVIGAGPAGLAAATAAARTGARVIVIDKNPLPGGSLNWRGGERSIIDEAQRESGIRFFLSCEASGEYGDDFIAAHGEDASWRIRAKAVVHAQGARDTPAVFRNNDLPGVMLTSAALRLAFLYDLACGRRAVMLAAGEQDAAAARALSRYGVPVAAVFNIGDSDAPWMRRLAEDGFAVHDRISSFEALGGSCVEGARAVAGGREVRTACDCILINGGAMPSAEAAAATGISFPYDSDLRRPAASHSALAGAVHNRGSLAGALEDGRLAGELAAARAETDGAFGEDAVATNMQARPPADSEPSPENVFLWGGRGKAFVDFDADLQPRDLDDAIDEGFDDIQLFKRYTTAGMGPSQGKLTNILVLRSLLARRPHEGGGAPAQITARPPAAAETLLQLARRPAPIRRTPLHHANAHLAAKWMTAGAWLRPARYGAGVEEEAQAVRRRAGVADISTLGKIQVSGPDAAALLGRLYAGPVESAPVGSARYALMLDESGVIADDGVAARLDDSRFWVTATTGNADAVFRRMLLWRARWRMRADIVSMTSAFAAISLAGPESEPIIEALTNGKPPGYMKAAEINVMGAPAIVIRVGFVGEKGWEIHLPAGRAAAAWDFCIERGALPFGVEAQRLLRLEKGHIIVGHDTDGLTTPLEAGMEWALGRSKEFYLGRRALDIHRRRGAMRQLLGFIMDPRRRRAEESDLTLDRAGEPAGRVTSVAYSPSLDRVVGLAYAPAGTPRNGGSIRIRSARGEILDARTAAAPFYDPKGERMR